MIQSFNINKLCNALSEGRGLRLPTKSSTIHNKTKKKTPDVLCQLQATRTLKFLNLMMDGGAETDR
jgi:hypothetical protein